MTADKVNAAPPVMHASSPGGLRYAKTAAEACARSPEFAQFVETVRRIYPWRFERLTPDVLQRDYLRIVDHHLTHLIPKIEPCIGPEVRRVLDFGCGSGGSTIALALTFPGIHCHGTDIDETEIQMARERAKLYNVADRCEFQHVKPGEPLPFRDDSFDFSLCSSVLEYAVEEGIRKFCVREIVRLVAPGRCLYFSVPNRLYPFEIHTGKWGWNYFPRLLRARTVDSTFWEIRKLAQPDVLTLYRTPIMQLFRPWSTFCVRRNP